MTSSTCLILIVGASRRMYIYAHYSRDTVESAGGTFQIRPFKEFVASKGRDRLLGLDLFNQFAAGENDLPRSSDSDSHSSRPTNAYDFMKSRRTITGDPAARRWNALVRVANFASVELSPLCV